MEETEAATGRISRLRARVLEGVEWVMTTAWRPVVIGRAAYERDRDIGGGLLAGAIAFRFFVWIAAFSVVVVALLGFVADSGGDPAQALADGGVTAIAASEVASAAADVRDGRWLLLLGGLYALFSTSRTMARALWTTSAIAWRQPVTRSPTVKGALAYNAVMFATLGTIAGAGRLRDATPGPGLVITMAAVVVFVGIAWVALQWLPGPGASPRELLPGAVLLAVGLHVMHLVATLYLPGRLERASDTYGTLGTAIVLLLWLYLMGRLLVAGGVLNAVMHELGQAEEPPGADAGPAAPDNRG